MRYVSQSFSHEMALLGGSGHKGNSERLCG